MMGFGTSSAPLSLVRHSVPRAFGPLLLITFLLQRVHLGLDQ